MFWHVHLFDMKNDWVEKMQITSAKLLILVVRGGGGRRTQTFSESPEFEECPTSATLGNHSSWCQPRTGVFQQVTRWYG